MAANNSTAINKCNRLSTKWNIFFFILLFILFLIVLIPIALVVIISFSSSGSIAANGYSFFPTEWTFDAYRALLFEGLGTQILNSYMVTIAQTVVGTVLSLLVMSLYAYVLAQKRFPARRFYTLILFITMLFSGGMVPSYMVNTQLLHLYDTFWVFIFPSLVGAYNVIILRTFIQTTIPETLFDAAKIDGANDFVIFFRIVLPLFKAGLATIALFCAVGRWNDWFTAVLYIENSHLIPIQTMLQKIQANIEFIKQNSMMLGNATSMDLLKNLPTESTRMAIVVISTIPIVFAYPFFQRYFVQGITVGSIKG